MKYGGQFERKIRIGIIGNILRPIYVEQTIMDWDTGKTLHYDTNMDSTYISQLLKKYSKRFKELFTATKSRFINDIENRRNE